MSLKKNVIANSAGNVGPLFFLLAPWHAKHLGDETHGLIGFPISVQPVFLLLSSTLSPFLVCRCSESGFGQAFELVSTRTFLKV